VAEIQPTPRGDAPRIQCDGLIGKCENLIIHQFVFAEAYKDLAPLFAAKPTARPEQFKYKPAHCVAGTTVIFTYSLPVAFLIQQAAGIF